MAGWRSTPAQIGWRPLALAGVTIWVMPGLLGTVLLWLALGLGRLFGLDGTGEALHPLLALHLAGWVMLFSPVLSWIGLIIALPAAWWLLRRGLGGWGSFALLGLVVGMLAGGIVPGFSQLLAAVWGLLAALSLRAMVLWLIAGSP